MPIRRPREKINAGIKLTQPLEKEQRRWESCESPQLEWGAACARRP